MRKLIAWREDGTPKRQQLWEEWLKIRSGQEPLTTKEWGLLTLCFLGMFAIVTVVPQVLP